MNIFNTFKDIVSLEIEDMENAGTLPVGLEAGAISVEASREAAHGDLATNAALVLAKQAGKEPREIATPLAEKLRKNPDVADVEVAGPGFINLTLRPEVWRRLLIEVLTAGPAYGASNMGAGKAVNVEYVSANPTGPLHIGHCRGAVFGDALANLLEKAGFRVTREYYINDAGAQIEALARALYIAYRELLVGSTPPTDVSDEIPYLFGITREYLDEVAEDLAQRDGEKWLDEPEQAWRLPLEEFAVDAMMELIKKDLKSLAIKHEVFTFERELHDSGRVQAAFDLLKDRDLIYRGQLKPPKGKAPEDWEPREQDLFRATEFGDDVDRPLRKSDGSWTYFAADIAYHLDKFERGFADMIDVWGADHGGYVKRMKAAVAAVSEGKGALDVKICAIVRVLDEGVPVRMSKRTGDFIALRDVVKRVNEVTGGAGKGVVRFMMLTRRNDAQLDFDFAVVAEQSKDNPVFYVQYAHARVRSLMRRAAEEVPALDATPHGLAGVELNLLSYPEEFDLIKTIARWPSVVEFSAAAHEPHRIAFYLSEIAAEFHALWNKGNDDVGRRFIVPGDAALTGARLALAEGVAVVIAVGLVLMGVEPVEEMR